MRYILAYVDILGFDERAMKEAETVKRPVEDIRDCYINSVEKRLQNLEKEKLILKYKKKDIDSWLFLSKDFWEALKCINTIIESKLPYEIAIHILDSKDPIGEDFIFSNELIKFLKNKIIEKHRNWYKEVKKDSIIDTFILLTEDTYKELEYQYICSKPNQSDYYIIENNVLEMFIRNLDRIQGNIHIMPGEHQDFQILKSCEVQLIGNFTVHGGLWNSILARIYDKENYDNWKNGHLNNPICETGVVTTRNIDLKLPAGEHYFVFSNRLEDGINDYQYEKAVETKIKVVPLPNCRLEVS